MNTTQLLSFCAAAALASGCASPKASQTAKAKPEAEKFHQRGWIGGEFKVAHKIWFFGAREEYVAQLPTGLASTNHAGILITALSTNTPAHRAGLREGDLILDCAHRPITTLKAFHRVIDQSPPGQLLALTVWREGRTLDYLVPVGRETYKDWGSFRLGLSLPNFSDLGHFDLWPNPGFDLWALGFEPTPNDRKELGSAEAVYTRACQKGKYLAHEQDWEAWLVIFSVERSREIFSQEPVPAKAEAAESK